jgi:hypothetical protein
LPPPQIFIFDQALECACEPLGVSGRRRIAVQAILNQIGHTTYFARDYDGKSRAHGFVHGKPPGFVFRRQRENV